MALSSPRLLITLLLAAGWSGCFSFGPRYGTSRTLYVQQVAERGRWIAACQPTKDTDGDGRIHVHSGDHGETYGDALTLFVFLEGQPPLAVEELYEATPDDRLLAVAIGGRLVLLDAVTGERTDVAPAPPWSPTVPRVSFSRDGSKLLAVIDGALWSRDVTTGHIQRTQLPPGDFASPESGPGGSVFLRELTVDTDGDGELRWEQADTTLHLSTCTGAANSWSTRGRIGDVPTGAIVTPRTGDVVRFPARLHPFSTGYVSERPGTLTFHSVDGSQQAIVPSTAPGCVVTPLHLDPTRDLVLFHCGEGRNGFLHAWKPRTGVRALPRFRGELDAESVERYPGLMRVFPLHAQGDPLRSQAVLDLDTLVVRNVGGVPTHSAGAHLITRTWLGVGSGGWQIAWVDVDTGTRRVLDLVEWSPRAAAGDFVVFGHDVFDMRAGKRVGSVDDGHGWDGNGCRLVALDATGRVLVRANADDRGPLLWVQPGTF